MANLLIPEKERDLTPDQVARLDNRRRRGLMLLVISGEFAIISAVLLLWTGQDFTYSPGRAHLMDYYFALTVLVCLVCGFYGFLLRRGAPEF